MFKSMTHARLARAGIASAVIAAAVIVAVTAGAFAGSGTSQAAPTGPADMTVSAPATAGVGSSFPANVNVGYTGGPSTWGGYTMQLGYNPGVLSVTTVAAGGLAGCSGANWGNPQTSPTVITACFAQSTVAQSPPPSDIVTFTCIAPGSSPLHLVTLAEDATNGSTLFDENAVNIVTDLFDDSVTCTLPITKSDSTGGTAIAGSSHTYTIHVGDPGATSSPGHTVSDTVPAAVNVTGVTTNDPTGGGCGNVGNQVDCTALVAMAGTGTDVTVAFSIPLSSAGQTVCNTATLDNMTTSNNDCFNVAPASLSITKVADAASYQAGDPISWTITITSNGPSPAAGVTITDTPTDGWTVTGNGVSSGACVVATNTTWTCGDMNPGDTSTVTIAGTVNDPNPTDNTCDDSVAVQSTNGASASAAASADCLSKNVRMVKSDDNVTAPTASGQNVNLFLNNTCGVNGDELCPITIYEWALNVGGDPDGVGAFEFQLKFDHKIFDISIAATGWLYATGRVPGASGIGGCAATIITENDIRFGCVSKNPVDGNGDPVVTIGNQTNGVIAEITVYPEPDLVNRITPGNDNGVIRTLLDENCEFADIWGHPLSTNQLDQLGREILLPGVGPGGIILDCADVTITVRILEGDMNLDCTVDVTDDQIEASHYGASFGSLLYQPWYDLEPWMKDFDVDIKDLQKVFGRNGSTCANPVPAQPAQSEPVPQ